MIKQSLRLWHTVKYLKMVQVYGRLWHLLYRPRPDERPAPAVRKPAGVWQGAKRPPCQTGPNRFRFLNVEREVAAAGDWNNPAWPKLWLYNAHYFNDLVAEAADAREDWHRALMARWIQENPPGQGCGWDPYPSSLRLVNWIRWALAGHELKAGVVQSLAVQTRYLRQRLEIHLLGNHLWANLKALVFAGSFFQGTEAAAWRQTGLKLLRRELREQILPDGGHFERSPMYHAILLEDVLDLIQLAQRYPNVFHETDIMAWENAARRMLRWLQVMTHPDGDIAFFNDAAFDIACRYGELLAYAQRLGLRVAPAALGDLEILPDSGYVRLSLGQALVLADVGDIGPDYLPGHAHADTLSFELSLGGSRVLVNGGTSTYEAEAERLRQRGTAAHNTVVVDGQDSSEVWSSFRVARRARVSGVTYGRDREGVWLQGAHDGYYRLPGRVQHRRRWHLRPEGLMVTDSLEGRFTAAQARFHFAPKIQVDAAGKVEGAPRQMVWRTQPSVQENIGSGKWCPRFGEAHACTVLAISLPVGATAIHFHWN